MSADPVKLSVDSIFGLAKPTDRSMVPGGASFDIAPADIALTPAAPKPPPFSIFRESDAILAANLASELGRVADAGGTATGLQDASAVAAKVAETNPGLARQALGLFATHHPLGKETPIPSLLKRTAELADFATFAAPQAAEVTLGSQSSGAEVAMDWFREDPLANEHHEHWHWVYPRKPPAGVNVKERHGELFYYMHQQMLARYDAERIAVGLQKVEAIADILASVGAGYDPGRLDTGPTEDDQYTARKADQPMVDLPDNVDRATLQQLDTRLSAAARQSQLKSEAGPIALSGSQGSDLLGHAAEPTIKSANLKLYGNHHGFGHVLSAAASPGQLGVMRNPATAIRDPVFWRWHRRVDDIHFIYQDSLPAQMFDDAPPVSIKTIEVLAEAADGTAGAPMQELRTTMRKGFYKLLDGKSYRYDYLSHDPFAIKVALGNSTSTAVAVTLRLFLIPHDLFGVDADPTKSGGRQMRRFVIELDKVKLNASTGVSRHVRSGRDMSVIRRPAVIDPAEVADIDGGTSGSGTQECTCGWPYGLLVPRGTGAGMAFSLFAMVTNNRLDRVETQKACGSMSFCGSGDFYPDKRAMGYPFDRPLAQSLAATVAAHPNMALKPLTIRWSNPPTS